MFHAVLLFGTAARKHACAHARMVPVRENQPAHGSGVVLFLTSYQIAQQRAAPGSDGSGGSDVWGNSRRRTEWLGPVCALL